MSHTPRVHRKFASSGLVLRLSDKYAPVPTSRKKTGAQKCVIQRVKKSGTVVVARLVGLTGRPRKSRTWSSAIRTMTTPRRISTDSMRACLPAATSVAVDIRERQCSKKDVRSYRRFRTLLRSPWRMPPSTYPRLTAELAGAQLIGVVTGGAMERQLQCRLCWDGQLFRG